MSEPGAERQKMSAESRAKRVAKRLRECYRIGQKLNEKKDARKSATFRSKVTSKFVKQYGVSEYTLRKFAAFAREYKISELNAFCRLKRHKDQMPLHWGYVQFLLTLPSATKYRRRVRKMLAQEAATKGWTPQELYAEIKKRHRNPRQLRMGSLGGRPRKKKQTLNSALEDLKKAVHSLGPLIASDRTRRGR